MSSTSASRKRSPPVARSPRSSRTPFDGVEIWRVGRQELKLATTRLDQLVHHLESWQRMQGDTLDTADTAPRVNCFDERCRDERQPAP